AALLARVGVRRPRRARARRVLRLHARPRGRADAGGGAGWNGARPSGARRAARVPDLPEAARAPRPAARGTAARLHVEPQAEVRRALGGDTRPRARPAAARPRLGARLAQRTCARHAVATEGGTSRSRLTRRSSRSSGTAALASFRNAGTCETRTRADVFGCRTTGARARVGAGQRKTAWQMKRPQPRCPSAAAGPERVSPGAAGRRPSRTRSKAQQERSRNHRRPR